MSENESTVYVMQTGQVCLLAENRLTKDKSSFKVRQLGGGRVEIRTRASRCPHLPPCPHHASLLVGGGGGEADLLSVRSCFLG